MVAVAAAIRGKHVRKCGRKTLVFSIDSVAKSCVILCRIGQDSGNRTRGDIDDIIDRPASLRESSKIAREEAEAFLTSHGCGRNTGVEPQQVSNRTRIR